MGKKVMKIQLTAAEMTEVLDRAFSGVCVPEVENTLDASADESNTEGQELLKIEDTEAIQNWPTVEMFSDESVAALKRTMAGKSSEASDRIQEVLRKLRMAGPMKNLATVPPGFELMFERLMMEFPNFHEPLEVMRDLCRLSMLGDQRLNFPPMLFNGPPGIGKTELLRRLATELKTNYLMIDMASAQSGASLSGSDSFWSNSCEGDLFKLLAFRNIANPIVLLDELDKVGENMRYSPLAPLFGLLERSSARCFKDLSVKEVTLDASHILWFASTNDLSRVNEDAILSRFTIFEIPAPDLKQTAQIAKNIYRGILKREPWGVHMAAELDEAVADCLSQISPRAISKEILAAFGRAVKAGRKTLIPEDIALEVKSEQTKRRIGFL